MNKNRRTLIFILLLTAMALFYVLKYQGPAVIADLYRDGHFDLLNRLTASSGTQPLDFYTGRAQETFWGPASQIIAGLAFAAFGMLFLQGAGRGMFFCAVLAFLVLTKPEVLTFPPYGDAVGGPFAEALWLYKNSFNYFGLAQEPPYSAGGPRVYLFSIYPTYLAILYQFVPSVKAFLIVNHMAVFAMTAAISSWLRDLFMKFTDKASAILGALIFLFLPLTQSQTEAINMEIPVTFFAVWAAVALTEKKFGRAALLAILAALTKGTGVIACAAVALIGGLAYFYEKDPRTRRVIVAISGAGALAAALIVYLKFFVKDHHVTGGMVKWAAGWPSLKNELIFYLILAGFLAYIAAVAREWRRERACPLWTSLRVPTIMMTYAVLWFLLFFDFFAVSPRYRILLYPFFIFALTQVFFYWVRQPRVQRGALILVMLLSLYGAYGAFYRPIEENDHVMLERSLEYRNDLVVNMRLTKRIEEHYADKEIAAPFVLAQSLAIPELGYVTQKLNVTLYGFRATYGGIKEYRGLANVDVPRTIFVGVKVVQLHPDLPFPVGPNDRVIEEIRSGNKKADLFMGGFAIENVWRMMQILRKRSL